MADSNLRDPALSRPRTEAGILGYDDLTNAQKEVADQILSLLFGMAVPDPSRKTADPSSGEASLIALDPFRDNHVLLIDGARGSGKTSVLIFLLHLLQRHYECRILSYRRDPEDKSAQALAKYPSHAYIIPVALIDLAPLPPTSNLLLHMVACLEHVVNALENDGYPRRAPHPAGSPPVWHKDASEQLKSRRAWSELNNAVVFGWDRQQLPRDPDPELYVREFTHAERQRHTITQSFTNFFGALLEDYGQFLKSRRFAGNQNQATNPALLFLLAVDDVDMSPSRIPELLDALRLFGHRQLPLAIVFTGHTDLFARSLRNIYLGEIARPVSSLRLKPDGFETDEDLSVLLSTQVYDKLIPPHHRCLIKPIEPEKRFTEPLLPARSLVPEDSSKPNRRSLRTLLAEITRTTALSSGPPAEKSAPRRRPVQVAGTGTASGSLVDIVDRNPWLGDALPDHMRPLINLAHLLDIPPPAAPRGGRPILDVSHFLKRLWDLAADSNRDVAQELGSVEILEQSAGLHVVFHAKPGLFRFIPCDDKSQFQALASPDNSLSTQIRSVTLQPEYGPSPREANLRRRAVASMLLAGLYADAGRGAGCQLDDLLFVNEQPGFVLLLISCRLTLNDGFLQGIGPRRVIEVPWPVPRGLTLMQQACLANRWKLLQAQRGVSKPDALALTFLDAISSLDGTAPGVPASREAAFDDAFDRLQPYVRQAPQPVNSRETALIEWVHLVGVVAAPESGLDAQTANQILARLRLAAGIQGWRNMRPQIRAARRERLRQAFATGPATFAPSDEFVEQFISRIDSEYAAHDFSLEVEHSIGVEVARLLSGPPFHRTVAPSTQQLFDLASAHFVRKLQSRLDGRAEKGNDLRALVRYLWELSEDRLSYGSPPDLADEQVERAWAAERLGLSGTADREPSRAEGTLVQPTAKTQQSIALIGGLFPCAVHPLQPPFLDLKQHKLSSLSRAIYELAWDGERHEPPAEARVPTWPGWTQNVSVLAITVAIAWPGVRWRTLWAAGHAAFHWNATLDVIRSQSLIAAKEVLLESLAFYYIDLVFSVPFLPQPLPIFGLRSPSDIEWAQLLKGCQLRIEQAQASPLSTFRESAALGEFLDLLPLFLTPEAGLPNRAVGNLLKFLTDSPETKRQVQRLPDLREKLLEQSARDAKREWHDQAKLTAELERTIGAQATQVDQPYWVYSQPVGKRRKS